MTSWTDVLTSIGAVLAGLGGLGWLATAIWRFLFGGEERRANAAVALTGAAKVMVDELQEEVRAARAETKAAREETVELRHEIDEMRRLTQKEIRRLEADNARLEVENQDLRRRFGPQGTGSG